VSLTKVKQDRRALKRDLASNVQETVDRFTSAYVFSYENMRSAKFKDIRGAWADSRFFLGKNRVMQLALGDNEASEYKPGLSQLAGDLHGNVGLLFTSRPHAAVTKYFAEYAEEDYARSGFTATETVVIPPGRMEEMPHTMADTLRKLGMPVRLDKGVVVNGGEFTVCREGEPITPEQGRLLKIFGKPLAVFKITLHSWWHDGKYESLALADFGSKYGLGSGGAAAGGKGTRKSTGGAGAGGKAGRRRAALTAADDDEEDDEDGDEDMEGGDDDDEDMSDD
jgi:mRNA turnover protein 4